MNNDGFGKVLMMLAGFSGVGKTFLLLKALEKNIPLFGEELADRWLGTRPPARFPEWVQKGGEVIESGTWFSTEHLKFLAQLPKLPTTVVLHVDLLSLLLRSSFYTRELQNSLEVRFPRKVNSILDVEKNRYLLRYFLSQSIFQQFDYISVNTLIADWEILRRRWLQKTQKKHRRSGNRDLLFGGAQSGELLMTTTNSIWQQEVSLIEPDSLFITYNADTKIRIERQTA